MTSTVEMLDQDDLSRRRQEVLARVGMPEAELRERAAKYQLTATELAALDELVALDYLSRGSASQD